ncbi:hypothetical protein JAAARDRAFT_197455 [Jaapia argillacea MUCL 33604]|uniref:Uncharacterized protein n=1 Tax=Jaapia argillacea MUCL 33604 TaxID=933084 RepID=A0A067PPR4_9AGAM|nr:hypothetical protein JAAARDRAFT_197455 [Jaapia argillacea MUCL 33604]
MNGRRFSSGVKMTASRITKAELWSLQVAYAEPFPPSPPPVPSKYLPSSTLYPGPFATFAPLVLQTWSHNYNGEVESGSKESLRLREELEAREKEAKAARKELNDVVSRIGGEESGVLSWSELVVIPNRACEAGGTSQPAQPNVLVTHPSTSPTPTAIRVQDRAGDGMKPDDFSGAGDQCAQEQRVHGD